MKVCRAKTAGFCMGVSLALQKLTTREPDPAMLEVSIAALERVLEAEGVREVPEPTSTFDKVADYPGAVL